MSPGPRRNTQDAPAGICNMINSSQGSSECMHCVTRSETRLCYPCSSADWTWVTAAGMQTMLQGFACGHGRMPFDVWFRYHLTVKEKSENAEHCPDMQITAQHRELASLKPLCCAHTEARPNVTHSLHATLLKAKKTSMTCQQVDSSPHRHAEHWSMRYREQLFVPRPVTDARCC